MGYMDEIRKKNPYLKRGTAVKTIHGIGTVTSATATGHVRVRIAGRRHATPFHPGDVIALSPHVKPEDDLKQKVEQQYRAVDNGKTHAHKSEEWAVGYMDALQWVLELLSNPDDQKEAENAR